MITLIALIALITLINLINLYKSDYGYSGDSYLTITMIILKTLI